MGVFLIYSVLGTWVPFEVEDPLGIMLASIIDGLFVGSILGGSVVLIMWLSIRLAWLFFGPEAPDQPIDSDG